MNTRDEAQGDCGKTWLMNGWAAGDYKPTHTDLVSRSFSAAALDWFGD